MSKKLLSYEDVKNENLKELVFDLLKRFPDHQYSREEIDEMQFRTIDKSIYDYYLKQVEMFMKKHNRQYEISEPCYDIPFLMDWGSRIYELYEGKEVNSYDLDKEGQSDRLKDAIKLFSFICEYGNDYEEVDEIYQKAYQTLYITACHTIEEMLDNISEKDLDLYNELYEEYEAAKEWIDIDEEGYDEDFLYISYLEEQGYDYKFSSPEVNGKEVKVYEYTTA